MITDKDKVNCVHHSVNCLRIAFRSKARLFLVLAIVALCTASYQLLNNPYYYGAGTGDIDKLEKKETHMSPKYDGGKVQNSTSKLKFVVDTTNCKIPELDPMDASIRDFLKPDFGYPVDCRGSHRAWAFMDGTTLKINISAVHESGYSTNSIYCCYKTIERVEQPLSDYDINADNYVKYSDKCHPMKNGAAQIDAEFIRVHCISKSIPILNDVVYRDFFAIPQAGKDRLVARKLRNWKRKSKRGKVSSPPNVVIIGIDNNSRMNSHRHLKKTLQVLESMGAVELKGYTKVAENTYPNSVPFLSGYSVKDIRPICQSPEGGPEDDCPYIWKAFDQLEYVTVHAEDAPYLGGFNYLKTGFLRKPTDFYLRPLFLAVMTHLPRFDYYHTDCIGRFMTDEFVFNYMLEIMKLTNPNLAPVFIHSWLTSLAHHSYNNIKFGDESIANFVTNLVQYTDDNTIFFFVSDHGQRYGPIRETTQGWYEDKLPSHWIYLPPKFKEWRELLTENSNKLTSHFDLYHSILHILKSFDSDGKVNRSFYEAEPNQKGQSLFKLIPENRTCEDAGITVNFCPCSKPEPVDINSQEVRDAADAAVAHLASLVPADVCAPPTLKRIVNAGYMKSPLRPVYVISLYTDPGDFLFEVNVEKELSSGNYVISTDLLRMNKISRAATCVSTSLLERYCYCK